MTTRLMTGAFLIRGGKVLLMLRSETKKLAPGMWSCVGGHIEPDELNAPRRACLREIEEETGIQPDMIHDLKLRYMTVRHTGDEIRVGHYFVGHLTRDVDLPFCDEGTLHWIDLAEAAARPMTFSVRCVTEHIAANLSDENLYLCGINRENDNMTWVTL
jgi:8-oxo-dGTP diphosphatase